MNALLFVKRLLVHLLNLIPDSMLLELKTLKSRLQEPREHPALQLAIFHLLRQRQEQRLQFAQDQLQPLVVDGQLLLKTVLKALPSKD